ncbi:MAG: hypothetical protein H6735_32950 [Alphaproteobacteria bacterium]|nr:hypothetical protein [Alphaproteobacteria bacterium]
MLATFLILMTTTPSASAEEPATAEVAPPSFSGTWVLDHAASDDLDAVLEAQGVPGWQRKLVAELDVSLTIWDEGDRLRLRTVTVVRTNEAELVLDGVVHEIRGDQGKRDVTAVREDDGSVRITATDPKGKKPLVEIRRALAEEGAVLRQTIEVRPDDGPPLRASQVYRRSS